MSMYFLDETDDWPEYQTIRDEIHRLEKERCEVLEELREIGRALTSGPAEKDLIARSDGLKEKLKEIEEKLDSSLSMYR